MTRGGGGNGGSFIVGHVMNRVQRSRYGRKLVQNMTTEIREAKIFASVQGTVPKGLKEMAIS